MTTASHDFSGQRSISVFSYMLLLREQSLTLPVQKQKMILFDVKSLKSVKVCSTFC